MKLWRQYKMGKSVVLPMDATLGLQRNETHGYIGSLSGNFMQLTRLAWAQQVELIRRFR